MVIGYGLILVGAFVISIGSAFVKYGIGYLNTN